MTPNECCFILKQDRERESSMQATELEKTENYYRTQMQKDRIVERLKENGCRITKQRMVLMDVILSGNCSSCKEIYYKASKIDPKIGTATVYRMVNLLEEIGAISRVNLYEVTYVTEKRPDWMTVQYVCCQKWSGPESLSGACGHVDILTGRT
mgnify:CR=1 FL=1